MEDRKAHSVVIFVITEIIKDILVRERAWNDSLRITAKLSKITFYTMCFIRLHNCATRVRDDVCNMGYTYMKYTRQYIR